MFYLLVFVSDPFWKKAHRRAEGRRHAQKAERLRTNIAHFPVGPWLYSDDGTEGGSLSSAKAQDVHIIWAAE